MKPSPDSSPTPYPDLNAVLADLTSSLQTLLGAGLVGVYLQGSFAVGGFDPHSDVDFVVAVPQELTAQQVAVLNEMHTRIYQGNCPWAQHLEGSYFPLDVLRDINWAGQPLWYLDHGSQTLERLQHCNTVVVRWTLRQHGVTLAGPPPTGLVDAIPAAELRQEIFDTLHSWGREILAEPQRYNNRFYQGFIVLSYCRMLRDLVVGETGSKRDGAEWAKHNLDPAWDGLIERAWDCRPDPARQVRQPADPQEFERSLAFVRHILQASLPVAESLQLSHRAAGTDLPA